MIRASNIHKSYASLKVLKGIDLRVTPGEIISVIGASGAGKSTLLHILGTLDKPDSGEVYYEDIAVFNLRDKELSDFRNRQIGFVFQFHHLLPEFTALENVCIPAFIAKTNRQTSEKHARELLKIMGLADRAHHKPSALSGGEQQRVAVARALVNNPKVIFADEPSGNLDSSSASDLHKLFFRLRDEFGQTFVIVTHNPEFAAMADRTVRISDGMIQ